MNDVYSDDDDVQLYAVNENITINCDDSVVVNDPCVVVLSVTGTRRFSTDVASSTRSNERSIVDMNGGFQLIAFPLKFSLDPSNTVAMRVLGVQTWSFQYFSVLQALFATCFVLSTLLLVVWDWPELCSCVSVIGGVLCVLCTAVNVNIDVWWYLFQFWDTGYLLFCASVYTGTFVYMLRGDIRTLFVVQILVAFICVVFLDSWSGRLMHMKGRYTGLVVLWLMVTIACLQFLVIPRINHRESVMIAHLFAACTMTVYLLKFLFSLLLYRRCFVIIRAPLQFPPSLFRREQIAGTATPRPRTEIRPVELMSYALYEERTVAWVIFGPKVSAQVKSFQRVAVRYGGHVNIVLCSVSVFGIFWHNVQVGQYLVLAIAPMLVLFTSTWLCQNFQIFYTFMFNFEVLYLSIANTMFALSYAYYLRWDIRSVQAFFFHTVLTHALFLDAWIRGQRVKPIWLTHSVVVVVLMMVAVGFDLIPQVDRDPVLSWTFEWSIIQVILTNGFSYSLFLFRSLYRSVYYPHLFAMLNARVNNPLSDDHDADTN